MTFPWSSHKCVVGWNSTVGTASRYGLDGPGVEYR